MIAISIILLISNILLIFFITKIATFTNIFDEPDKKIKLHKQKIPILGGLIYLINLLILLIYQIFILNEFLFLNLDDFKFREILGILILIIGFFILGLYDDKYNLTPLKKIFFSILFIIVSLSLNQILKISDFSISFYPSRIFLENSSLIFTIFCFLILMNSLNFYDGINGQSSTFFLIIFLYLFIKSDFNYFYLVNIFFLLIILFLNLKNRIFLGDSGIYLLSAIVSISLIYEYNFNESIRFADEIFFLLLLPGFDLIRLTFTRLIKGKNAFNGDRNHIHHLINKKLSLIKTNTILAVTALIPIGLFTFMKISFWIVFIIFVFIYISLILIFKNSEKN